MRPDGPCLRFGTGAGITWGSDPEREWEETELKASRLLAVASGTHRTSGASGRTESTMKIWLDGGLQDVEAARVSVLDHGLTVGDGVFETVKAVDGRPFALTRHLDRLARSARGLGLPEPDLDEVRRACAAVLDANPMPLGRLRITYTGGLSPLGSDRGDARAHPRRRPRRDHPAPRLHRRDHRPLDAQRARRARRPEDHLVRRERRRPRPRAPSRARPRRCSPTRSGSSARAPAPTSSSSSTARLHTPPVASGCLAGITRALAVEWTGAQETDLPLDVLERADEIFLTSTLRDVQAVHRVDGRELPGAPGPVTAKAMRIFDERAGADLDP